MPVLLRLKDRFFLLFAKLILGIAVQADACEVLSQVKVNSRIQDDRTNWGMSVAADRKSSESMLTPGCGPN